MLKLVKSTDPVLRQVSKKITKFDGKLRDLARELNETMSHHRAIGISACQCGKPIQLMVIGVKITPTSPNTTVMVNPELVNAEGMQTNLEGCLSLPGLSVPVGRPQKLWVRYWDLQGNKQEVVVEGFPAAVVSHEADHVLFQRLISDYL